MPLDKSGSKASVGANIKTEMAAGRPQKQVIAIFYAPSGTHHAPVPRTSAGRCRGARRIDSPIPDQGGLTMTEDGVIVCRNVAALIARVRAECNPSEEAA